MRTFFNKNYISHQSQSDRLRIENARQIANVILLLKCVYIGQWPCVWFMRLRR